MCNDPNLDPVNMNAYIKFGHNSGTNMQKRTCNNSKPDLANVNAYIKFKENLSICSQDMSGKTLT